MIKIQSLLVFCFIAAGCGTTQPFVPGVPLEKGEGEIRVSIGYATSNFSPFSLQIGGYAFIGNNNAVGFTLAGLLAPSTISFVHYSKQNLNFQLHYNNLFGVTFNPTIEMDVGYSSGSWDKYNAAKIGLGYYDAPLAHRLLGNRVSVHALVPTFGYQFRNKEFEFEANLIYGLSNYFVRYYNQDSLQHRPDSTRLSINNFRPQRVSRNSITSIKEIPDGKFMPGWFVFLNSDQTIVIASRDPYPDCLFCGIEKARRGAYLASPNHRVYWLWKSRTGEEIFSYVAAPFLMQLDMPKILDRYNSGASLDLEEDNDLLDRTLSRIHSGFEDIFFSISRVSKKK